MGFKHLLLIDDDRALLSVLSSALEEEGYQVTCAFDGKAGLVQFQRRAFDALIVDVLMPELDGLEVCRRVRATSQVPFIFLTSRSEEVDRVTGLETGADDYLVKPFSTRELIARLRALARRTLPSKQVASTSIAEGSLTIDRDRFEVKWKAHPVVLTRSELEVLAALASAPGMVLSRDRLIDAVHGDDVVITERTIDTFIKRIRQKICAVDETFDGIETVIGVGYRFRQ